MRRRGLGDMVIKVGMIGASQGNGHPFSFSAIINGYENGKISASGWPIIEDYLSAKDPVDFGIDGIIIDCVWTQDQTTSKQIAASCKIPKICGSLLEMLRRVDAVIIARDDWQSHYELAIPFLKSAKPVLIDKPLSLDLHELKLFKPYLETGLLMSCGAMRYAVELDVFRARCKKSKPNLISGKVVLDWERYGVHLLDGIFSAIPFCVESVVSTGVKSRTTMLMDTAGEVITLHCIGSGAKIFEISTCSETENKSYMFYDNFAAFKRLLSHFSNAIMSRAPVIPAELTLNIMKVLIAANVSNSENRRVYLEEINV